VRDDLQCGGYLLDLSLYRRSHARHTLGYGAIVRSRRLVLRGIKHWNAAIHRFPKPAGYRGVPMLRKDAEHEIIREWMNLPETERQSEHQAAQFALKMKRKYPFDYAGGDRYQEIRRMMLRHYKRLAAASK
jgi:hypothetical protein